MNIGIILPNLEMNQLAYETITGINQEILNGSNHDYRIFFENLSVQCVTPLCSIMNLAEIWAFSGLLISTTLDNTIFSLKLSTNVIKAFYIWDLEWIRKEKNYLHNLSILRNPNLLLISRSQDAAIELERYSNRPPNIVSSRLNMGELANVITS